MTKEEIEKVAQYHGIDSLYESGILDFANEIYQLGRKHGSGFEREACANICETLELPEWPDKVRQPLAQAIRARGQE